MIKLQITTSDKSEKKYKAVFTKPDGKTKTIHFELVIIRILLNIMTKKEEIYIESAMYTNNSERIG